MVNDYKTTTHYFNVIFNLGGPQKSGLKTAV